MFLELEKIVENATAVFRFQAKDIVNNLIEKISKEI